MQQKSVYPQYFVDDKRIGKNSCGFFILAYQYFAFLNGGFSLFFRIHCVLAVLFAKILY